MDAHDFAAWVSALQTYYPRFNLLPNGEAIELWYTELNDIPFEVLSAALRKWVNTERWPPSIAELRALCADITQGKAPDWGEAWREMVRAVGRYGYMRESEAMASLSPLTRKAVSFIGWQDICMCDSPEILRAQFRQVYESVTRREVEDRQLPPALKDEIALIGTSVHASLPQILPAKKNQIHGGKDT